MKIQILGSGCTTCSKLNDAVNKVINEMGLDAQVEYITGIKGITKITELGAMSSPVLAINDQIAMTGFTPDLEKIKEIINKFADEK